MTCVARVDVLVDHAPGHVPNVAKNVVRQAVLGRVGSVAKYRIERSRKRVEGERGQE